MSVQDGMAALQLEMPERIPRTEYSAHEHWDLVRAATGISVSPTDSPEKRQAASSAFLKAWNYDFFWTTNIGKNIFNGKYTKMGHAQYAAGGADFTSERTELCSEPEEVYALDFDAEYGARDPKQIVAWLDAEYQRLTRIYPDCVNMNGSYVTCMSGMIDLLGWDMLLYAAGVDPQAFGRTMDRYTDWLMQYFEALAACKSPVIMVHDDIVWTEGAFLHPDFYRRYVFPNFKKLFVPLHEAGKIIVYTSDGNYDAFVDDIAACGVNGFVMEPCVNMARIAEKYGKTHAFIGNVDTGTLLFGSYEDIYAQVKRCIDIGKDCPGYFMAVGNHIPANTPVDKAMYYNEVYEKLSRR